VTPGFVMKTTDMQKKQKVFVNICHSSAIQSFSQRKQLDEQGNEQEVSGGDPFYIITSMYPRLTNDTVFDRPGHARTPESRGTS
jgi:hypothetical protein